MQTTLTDEIPKVSKLRRFADRKRKNASSLTLNPGEVTTGIIAKELDIANCVVSDAFKHEDGPTVLRKQGTIRIYEKENIINWLEAHSKTNEGKTKFLYALANEVRRRYKETYKINKQIKQEETYA